MKFCLKRNSIISTLATLSYSITATQVLSHTHHKQMCPAFRQSKVLAHGQEIKMPQGVSVVSTATESEGSLTALDKQHLSFTLLCRWGILCKTTAAFLTGCHRQGWRLTQWEQLRAACRFCNLLSPFWCGYTFFSALCVILTGIFISSA